MDPVKTLRERESELRSLLATAAGREQLQALASKYHEESGAGSHVGRSAITYILVHERERGLIST